MLVVVAAHPQAAWMLALAALVAVEEATWIGRRLRRPAAAVLALAAGAVLLGA
jgi:predicted metal-binding membrane protein